jgi:hypothetical protein
MEHSIDLSACHFIKGIAPSSAQKIMKKIKHAFKEADIKDTVDLDALDTHLAEFDLDNDNQEFDVKDVSSVEVDAADSIGKALALVKQVFS